MATEPPWRLYEHVIHDYLKRLAGHDAEVLFDARVPGRFSEAERQVDILVKGRFPGISPSLSGHDFPLSMAVDCKCWSRSVALNEADRFAGFVEDLGLPLALLVTTKAFSEAAFKRIAGIRGAWGDVVPPVMIPEAFTYFYCVACRDRVEGQDPKTITMKNGKPALQAVCPRCGTKLFRIGAAPWPPSPPSHARS